MRDFPHSIMVEPTQRERPAQQEQSLFGQFISMAPRMIFIYIALQYMQGAFSPKGPANPVQPGEPQASVRTADGTATPHVPSLPPNLHSAWRLGEPTTLYVYLDADPVFTKYNDQEALVMKESDMAFGDFSDERTKDITIPCTSVCSGSDPR